MRSIRPGTPGAFASPRAMSWDRRPAGEPGAGRRERVHDVEDARAVRIERLGSPLRRVEAEIACRPARRMTLRAVTSASRDSSPKRIGVAAVRQSIDVRRRVVGVHHGGLRDALVRRCVERCEEQAFGFAVGLEGLVEVEVVAGDVREDRDVVLDVVQPVQRQPVARALDDREVAARVGQPAQEALHLGRFRGRHAVRHLARFARESTYRPSPIARRARRPLRGRW